MAEEELHDIVDIEEVEPKSVHIRNNWEDESSPGSSASGRRYTITYSLPIKVSKTWQYMFQRPDPRSGVVHQISFTFSEDGKEVSTTLDNEPAPELLLVLKNYVDRANRRWQAYKEGAVESVSEEERLLRKLKGQK